MNQLFKTYELSTSEVITKNGGTLCEHFFFDNEIEYKRKKKQLEKEAI